MPLSLLFHHHAPLPPPLARPIAAAQLGSACPPGIVGPFPPPLPQAGVAVTRRARTVRCMANPRRVKMVAKQIRRELSDMLLTDKVLQYAILPEAALGADRYLSSLTTISDVEVSADLQVVKVYVSVFGDERGREVAIAGLKSKAKYVRSELGRRMKLRLTPEVRFIEDESLERGSRVISILDRIKAEKKMEEDEDDEQVRPSDGSQDNQDWEGDDPDEGIIYVD
ncbi:hypothetical protein CDL15_Pgr004353 [Punica granatum]|uniref:Ribosome-binding factor A, chloroplastic n=1 Tax=Punica granatum TaxID=22663 RepID=A0A218XHU8_PUNGR|nr:hypothetical protein CDL15_Pgr004353 [Punica granatum]